MEIPLYYYVLLFLFLHIFTKHFVPKSKRLPPSPTLSLPIVGHLYLFKNPIHQTFAKLNNQYGPILYVHFGSRSILLVSSPTATEECFTKNDIIFANRPRLLAGKHLGYNYTSIVLASYSDHWHNLRRIASLELLSSHRLQMLHGIHVDEVKALIRKLCGGSKGCEFHTVDMKATFLELTLNILMRMIAGKRYAGESVEELEETRKLKEIVMETFELGGANIGDFLPFFKWFGLGGVEKRLTICQGKRDVRHGKTMTDVLLSLQEAEPEYYTNDIIRGLMQWALSLLLNNPETIVKGQSEIDNHIGQSRLIEESDFANLPYVRGIINETLRMYPAAPLMPPHESSEECTVGGFNVPRGTMLLVNAWAIQNDPKIWEEPRKFKPERFQFQGLEGQKDGIILFPFGVGRRGCPGEGLATRIVGLAIESLIQCFEWKRIGEDMVDMTEKLGLTMHKAQPLLAKCRPLMMHIYGLQDN
ncbi:hypothetical protein ACB092_01G018500 [Castanea dentata]